MNGCIVCDIEVGYCEFCPEPDREVGHIVTARNCEAHIVRPDKLIAVPDLIEELVTSGDAAYLSDSQIKRSYTATYRIGDTFRKHLFIGPDSFLEAVYDAEGQCEMGEQLINVTEMT